eukprot:113330_1
MGVCASCIREKSSFIIEPSLNSPKNDNDINPIVKRQKSKNTKFPFAHTKHYERYCNRQFKVSVCAAKGERKTMEDDHLCQFKFSNHSNYSLFGVFDGHNGSEASKYLANHLYETLNQLDDLENNQNIIASIQQMDKEFITNTKISAGSTIVFAITHCVPTIQLVDIDTETNSDSQQEEKCTPLLHSGLADSSASFLPGFAIKHTGRVFWCGDARAYLVNDSIDSFDVLTMDHNTKNKNEVVRVESMGGKIINGRVNGLLSVTRTFGDTILKCDELGTGVICECEYKDFIVDIGDSLLMCCDGLTEKWSNKILMKKLKFNLQNVRCSSKNVVSVDSGKAIGSLVDDAIFEGSDDNISVMFIQFKDGQKCCDKKYEKV